MCFEKKRQVTGVRDRESAPHACILKVNDSFKNTYLVKMDVVRRLSVQSILPTMANIRLYIVLIFCP